jgi:streptogramin lyase
VSAGLSLFTGSGTGGLSLQMPPAGITGSATVGTAVLTFADVPALKAASVTGLVSGKTIAVVVSPTNRLYYLRAQTVPPVVDDSAGDANFVIAPDGRVWFGG